MHQAYVHVRHMCASGLCAHQACVYQAYVCIRHMCALARSEHSSDIQNYWAMNLLKKEPAHAIFFLLFFSFCRTQMLTHHCPPPNHLNSRFCMELKPPSWASAVDICHRSTPCWLLQSHPEESEGVEGPANAFPDKINTGCNTILA